MPNPFDIEKIRAEKQKRKKKKAEREREPIIMVSRPMSDGLRVTDARWHHRVVCRTINTLAIPKPVCRSISSAFLPRAGAAKFKTKIICLSYVRYIFSCHRCHISGIYRVYIISGNMTYI